MNGRIIPTILGKGHGFPEIGPPPTFWPFMVHLGTITVPMCVSFIWCVKRSAYWGSRSSESQLVRHLRPRWFSCTLYISTHLVNNEEFNSKNTCLVLGWRKSSFGPTHYVCLVLASFLNANEILGLNLSKQRYKQRSLSFLVCQMGIVSVFVRENCRLFPSSKPYFLSDTEKRMLTGLTKTVSQLEWTANEESLTRFLAEKHELKISPWMIFFFSRLLPSKLTNTWPASIATPCKSLAESQCLWLKYITLHGGWGLEQAVSYNSSTMKLEFGSPSSGWGGAYGVSWTVGFSVCSATNLRANQQQAT